MKSDFLIAITQLSAEKNLPREVILEAVEAALVSAYKKDEYVANQNISVTISPSSGEVKVFAQKAVVEVPDNPQREIALAEVRKLNQNVQIGEIVEVEVTPRNAGRIAAQTAKQVVLQRLREAEHDAIFEQYSGKEGEVVSGVVQRMEPRQILVDLGRAVAVLPSVEQVRNERYRPGQRLKVYLMEVVRTSKGPQVLVSRSHPHLLRRLFELEVPEIYNGVVELKAIAREAGYRSKVAVSTSQPGIDPVGCCVGLRGIRIQNIVSELNGEKIDVVLWDANPIAFIPHALSPAQVLSVQIDEAENTAEVVVPDRQLSLAIGREGQNARLAAKLTGWRIDIKPASAAEAEKAALVKEAAPEEVAPEAEAEEPTPAEAALEPEAGEPIPVEAALEPEAGEPIPVEAALELELTGEVEEEAPKEEIAPEVTIIPVKIPVAEVPSGKPQLRFAEDIMGSRRGGGSTKGKKKRRKGDARSSAGKEEAGQAAGGRRA
ncbi:MAG: transcription termination factor NusA, partial [Dehalococcoidia bacterium]